MQRARAASVPKKRQRSGVVSVSGGSIHGNLLQLLLPLPLLQQLRRVIHHVCSHRVNSCVRLGGSDNRAEHESFRFRTCVSLGSRGTKMFVFSFILVIITTIIIIIIIIVVIVSTRL